MRTVLKLAFAFMRQHPVRTFLTCLATMAAACMVIWVVSGYDALLNSFDDFSDKSLGRYTLSVAPINTYSQYAPGAIPSHAEKYVPPEVVKELRADPVVACADPMWAQREAVRPSTGIAPWRLPDVRLLGTDASESPFPLTSGRWIDPKKPDALEAAISADGAKALKVGVGDEVLAGSDDRTLKLRIIGIVNTPVVVDFQGRTATGQLLTPSVGGLYVPMPLAERIVGQPSRISFVGVSLKPDADITKFRFSWSHRLSAYSTPVQFQEAHDIEEALDQSAAAENIKVQAYAATGMSMLAALFIIFSTLNMGVSERVRQFAMLRAVVLTRAQVCLLIMVEGLVLATIGFVGGIFAGKGLLWAYSKSSPSLLSPGAVMGANSIMLAAACAYGSALLASLIPAYRATRVRPVDAMAPQTTGNPGRVPKIAIVIGLLLLLINPLIIFVLPLGDSTRYALYAFAGSTSMAAGFILLAPAVVALVDRLVSPILARILHLDVRLMASQITNNLWRTVGTSVSLTIGLGLYIAIQVWGYTMLGSFVPGAWAPDALISFNPGGIPPDKAAQVEEFPGVDADRCLPLVFEQPRLRDDLTHSAERASVTRQDNVVIVGLDPERAFGGEHPLLKFEWVYGSPEEVIPQLEAGRACIVPDHFLRETGLGVGDSFVLVPPVNPDHPVSYRIAGAVRLPGWHWQTKPTGFRSRTHRAAALVFADYPSVAKDFSKHTASHVWFDYDAAKTNPKHLGADAKALYAAALGRDVAIGEAPGDDPYVKVMPIEGVRNMVRSHAKQWIWGMSRLPLVTLIVACIGVLNSILASVRARRWDMGVLRAIGFTRLTLVRLVIAEGLLIGIVACFLSLGFGIFAGWCGAGISQYISFFGGMHPSLIVPWYPVTLGLGAMLLLSAFAAVWPATSIGRTHPLTLLQQGRGAL